MEKLIIKDFACFEGELVIQLNTYNVFIGKQASGKSIIVKLINYFKQYFPKYKYHYLDLLNEGSMVNMSKIIINLEQEFYKYFDQSSWKSKSFTIQYYYNQENYIEISNLTESRNISIKYSEPLNTLIGDFSNKTIDILNAVVNQEFDEKTAIRSKSYYFYREIENFLLEEKNQELKNMMSNDAIFIPAARSFFSTVKSNMFTLLENDNHIDPVILQFGRKLKHTITNFERDIYTEDLFKNNLLFKKDLEQFSNLMDDILKGEYKRIDKKDMLVHPDGRNVEIKFASSGQQEVFPLLIVLKELFVEKEIFDPQPIIVEEPEAHLFPTAQRKIMELICLSLSFDDEQIENYSNLLNITTHSPYVLSTLNLLLMQDNVNRKNGTDYNERKGIASKYLNVYSVEVDKIESVMEENGLISAAFIDKSSEEIMDDFGNLLSEYYES